MALRRHPRRLLESWRAERRTLRQGLVALVLSTFAGFVAGLTLAHLTGRLEQLPGLIVLIPAAVGMRGTIFGAIGARLGTATAAGLFEPTLRRNGLLYRNVEVAVLTTFTSSLWLAVLAKMAGAAFGQPSISALEPRDHLGGRRGPRVGRHPARDRRPVRALVPPRMGPRLGLDADGDGPRRHGHAADALPRLAAPRVRDGGRRRLRAVRRRRPVLRLPLLHVRRPGRPPDRAGDDPGDPAHAGPRRARRRPAPEQPGPARRAPGAAPDGPAARLAGRGAGRHLLVADRLEAAGRRHPAGGLPGGARAAGRLADRRGLGLRSSR